MIRAVKCLSMVSLAIVSVAIIPEMSCSPLVGQFYVLKTPRSGVYVCDENDNSIEIEMSRAMIQMRYRMSVCIGGNSIGKDTVSGRVKVDTTGAGNLNIGYCNGESTREHSPDSFH